MSSPPVSVYLIPNQIQAIFQQIAATVCTLSPDPNDASNVNYGSRIGWQPNNQPAFKREEDICVSVCAEVDDLYNRNSDVKYTNQQVGDVTNYYQIVTYTRVWETMFTIYGPNSFDNARKLRTALRTDDATHDLLIAQNLALITNPTAPLRVPEQKGTSIWWERVDFRARFNELVTEVTSYGIVQSVHIYIEDSTGLLVDPVVPGPAEATVPNVTAGYGTGPYGEFAYQ